MSRVSVTVLTDDRLFSDGLLRILGADATLRIVTMQDAADIILVDGRMDGALHSTIRMCAAFKRDAGPAVIFVAAPDDDDWALEALAAGARGILLRNATTADMTMAIRMVSDGVIWARRRVISARLDHLDGSGTRAADRTLEKRLSIREREVFRQAATGLGNKQLARRLDISEATVKVHLTHIFQKLGVRGRAELAAAYHGILLAQQNQQRSQ